MAKLGYFKYKNGKYVPTEKFNRTAKSNPKKLLEDTFSTIEKRMDYDHIKCMASEIGLGNFFKSGIECYEPGKGICGDYAEIVEAGWKILQKYSPELRKIEVFTVGDFNMEHAWNGIKYGQNVTYVDITWHDSGGDLSAVDSKHYFTRKN